MIVLAWTLVALWGGVLLLSGRFPLRALPTRGGHVPPYTLWLPGGGAIPALDPAPATVETRAELSPDGPAHVLVLGPGVRVASDLPRRLAACGVGLVSVLPRPRGGLISQAVERLRRDLAAPARVNDVLDPAGYADPRCAWLRRADLALPGPEAEPVLRAARARKAHGLPVELRDGSYGGERDGATVRAPGLALRAHCAEVRALGADGPMFLWGLAGPPLLLCVPPLVLLASPGARLPALLALALGSAARLLVADRDRFGLSLVLAGWVIEPLMAITTVRWAGPPPVREPFPDAPTSPPPAMMVPDVVEGRGWLDRAAVPFLARRLGGSAPVIEQIERCRPAGRTPLGRAIDRAVQSSLGARAVRFRRIAALEAGRRLQPRSLLSVPCGGGGVAAGVAAPETVLADPDPAARALARRACPGATVLNARVETAPAGPFELILYVGLSEYLDDETLLDHLAHLRTRLGDGGTLLTTSTAEHPSWAPMARWLGWHIRPRHPDAMAELLDAAGFVIDERRTDPFGIETLFRASPR